MNAPSFRLMTPWLLALSMGALLTTACGSDGGSVTPTPDVQGDTTGDTQEPDAEPDAEPDEGPGDDATTDPDEGNLPDEGPGEDATTDPDEGNLPDEGPGDDTSTDDGTDPDEGNGGDEGEIPDGWSPTCDEAPAHAPKPDAACVGNDGCMVLSCSPGVCACTRCDGELCVETTCDDSPPPAPSVTLPATWSEPQNGVALALAPAGNFNAAATMAFGEDTLYLQVDAALDLPTQAASMGQDGQPVTTLLTNPTIVKRRLVVATRGVYGSSSCGEPLESTSVTVLTPEFEASITDFEYLGVGTSMGPTDVYLGFVLVLEPNGGERFYQWVTLSAPAPFTPDGTDTQQLVPVFHAPLPASAAEAFAAPFDAYTWLDAIDPQP